MSEVQDSWKEVASKAEALGLKLKLHLEQERDADSPTTEGETKAMLDDLSAKLSDAFDSVGNAAKDKAVHEDVKDIGRTMKDALLATFSAVGAEVNSRTSGGSDDTADAAADDTKIADAEVIDDSSSGDEAAGDDA